MLKRPTISAPKLSNKIRGRSYPVIIQCKKEENSVEAQMSLIGNVVPKMPFWQRVKYLFTGKVPVEVKTGKVEPPPFDIQQLKNESSENIDSGPYCKSYSTFAGCDIKMIFVHGLGENASRSEIERAYMGPCTANEIQIREESRKEHCVVVGEIQAISVKTVWPEEGDVPRTVGDLILIQFDRSIFDYLKDIEGSFHLMACAANEYGDLSTLVLPNFRLTSWSWGIARDDLISEAILTFEADEPMYWGWLKKSDFDIVDRK